MQRSQITEKSILAIDAGSRKDLKFFEKLLTRLRTDDPMGAELVGALGRHARKEGEEKKLRPEDVERLVIDACLFVMQAIEVATKEGESSQVGKKLMEDPPLPTGKESHERAWSPGNVARDLFARLGTNKKPGTKK